MVRHHPDGDVRVVAIPAGAGNVVTTPFTENVPENRYLEDHAKAPRTLAVVSIPAQPKSSSVQGTKSMSFQCDTQLAPHETLSPSTVPNAKEKSRLLMAQQAISSLEKYIGYLQEELSIIRRENQMLRSQFL